MDPIAAFFLIALFVVVINFVVASLIAEAAKRKGRSWAAFFWLSFIGFWAVMAIIVAAMPPMEGTGRSASKVKCPLCAELVKPEAKICMHCRNEIGDLLTAQAERESAARIQAANIEAKERQAAEAKYLEDLDNYKAAREERRVKLLKSKSLWSVLIAAVVIAIVTATWFNIRSAPQALAKVNSVVFNFEDSFMEKACLSVTIEFDSGNDEQRAALIANSSDLVNGGLDDLDLKIAKGKDSTKFTHNYFVRDLSKSKKVLAIENCDFVEGLGKFLTFEIVGKNQWSESTTLASGNVAIPWEKPSVSSVPKNGCYLIYSSSFAQTPTFIDGNILEADITNEYFERYDGYPQLCGSGVFTFTNPAGSQHLNIGK